MRWLSGIVLLLACTVLATAGEVTRTWNDAGTDWADGANWDGTPGFPETTDDVAEFGLAVVGNQPNLAAPQTIKRLTFTGAADITITGSALTIADATAIVVSGGTTTHTIAADIVLGANATIQVDGGRTLTISGAISGPFSLTKTGTGTLILSGTSTYTGATIVNAGDLQVTGGLAGSTSITVLGVASASIPGTVALQGATTFDIGAGTTVDVTGAISGGFGLVKTGNGTLALGASNTYTGATQVSAGVLSLTASGALNGTSGVTVSGTGQVALSGNVVLQSVPLTLSSSTVPALRSTSGFNIWPGSLLLGSASTIQCDAGTLILGGAINNAGLLLTCGGAGSTISSGIISNTGGLAKSGAGSLILAGANTYSGATSVGAGTLTAQHAQALGDNGSTNTITTVSAGAALVLDGTLSLSNRETIQLNGDGGGGGALRSISGSQTLAGPVAMQSPATIAVVNASSTLTISGILSGAHLLTSQGGGALALGNGSNSASGGLAIASGTLRLGGANVLPSGAISVNGTLDTVTFSPTIAGALSGSGVITGTASTATFTGGGTWNGTFASSVGVSVTAGTLTLSGSGTSTHSGFTTVSGTGTLAVNSATALGNGTTVRIGAGGTLALGNVSIARPVDFIGAGSIAPASGATAVLSGTLTGAAVINGAGTLSLPNASSFTSLALTAATLQFGNVASLGSGTVTVNSGTLAPTSALSPANAVTIAGDCALGGSANAVFGTVTINNAPVISVSAGRSHTFTHVRQGSGSAFQVAGTGTLLCDFTPNGGTAITGLTIQTGATWSTIANASVSLATLAGSGTAQIGSGTLTLTGTTTFAGSIAGSGALTVNSGGTVTLSGANAYTGATTVTSGTLTLAGDSGTIAASSSLSVTGASFTISNAGTSNPNRLADNLTVTLNSATFAMTAPTNVDRTETIGILRLSTGASNVQLTAAGTGDCQLTCGDGSAGFVSVSGGTFALSKTNGSTGTANLFSTNGFADGATVSFATGTYTIYKTASGLDTTAITTTTVQDGNWMDPATWDLGVPGSGTIAVIKHQVAMDNSSPQVNKLVFATGGTTPRLSSIYAGSFSYIWLPSGGIVEAQAGAAGILDGVSVYAGGGEMTLTTQTGASLTVQENGISSSTNLFYGGRITIGGSGDVYLANTSADLIAYYAGSFFGPVVLEGGRLHLVHVNGLPSVSTRGWTLNGGAEVDLTGDAQVIESVAGGGGVFTNSGAACQLTITNGGTLTGRITGALALTIGDSLTIQGPGSSTYTGATTVNGGTLTISKPAGERGIGSGSAVSLSVGTGLTINGDESIGTLAMAGGNTISVSSGATLSAGGAATFGGSWSLVGGGVMALAAGADSSGSGEGTISGSSTLRIARQAHLGTAVRLNLSSGTLAVAGSAGSITLPQIIDLVGAGSVDVGSSTTLIAGPVDGPGALSKLGSGIMRMGSTACTQASTTISDGTLQISDYRHLGAGGLTLDGGTLAVSASLIATTGPGGGGATRSLTIAAAGGVVDPAAAVTLTWPGTMGGTGTLTKTGAGTLALSGGNGGFSGVIAVKAGVLSCDSATALGGSASGTQVSDEASLVVSGAYALSEPISLAGDGGGAGALQLAAGSSIATGVMQLSAGATRPATIAVASGSATISSRVRGSGGLDKIGAGTLVLSDVTSDFNGTVDITAGTLSVADERVFGASGNTVALAGGTLTVTAPVTFNASRALQVRLAGGTISTGASTLTISGLDTAAGQNLQLLGAGGLVVDAGAAVNSTIGGSLYGSGSLTKTGTGNLTLQSANDGVGINPSYTGAISVLDGLFRINGSVAPASTCNVAAGAVLAGSGKLGVLTVAGTVRPGGLAAAGVLNAASLDLSATAILRFDLGTANDLLAVTGAVTVANGAELQIDGLPDASAFGVGDYTIISSGAAWTYTPGDMTVTYDAGISGATAANYRLVDGGTTLVLQRNRAPQVTTAIDTTPGTTSTSTTPPAYTVGPPGSSVLFSALIGSGPANKLVQAVDPEGVASAAQLVFTIQLDPSQGRIERYNGSIWQQVSSDSGVSPISTWNQADIDAGNVRYISTGSVGGNDAILYSCADNLGAVSPLYLMRFTIQGSGPPVISGLPGSITWSEQAAKPGPWSALVPAATLASSTDPLDGGLLKVTLLNGESGDELAFVGNGVSVSGSTVSLSGVDIGSLVATTSSLTVTLNANATQARVTALLQSASFRTSNSAPVATGRSIELRANDGSVAGGTTITAVPLTIDLYNDAPTLSLTVDVNGTAYAATSMPGIPNLLRTGRVTPSDPEGELAANVTLTLFQGALQGTLVFNPDGTFSYRPNFLSGSLTSEALEDSFIVTVTDRDFSVSPSATRVDGTGAASRYDAASRQVTVPIRIAAGGAGLAFRNVPRMTVDNLTGGSFSYTPQLQLPSGAGTIRFELIDVPGAVTLGTGAGQLNFSPSTGAISWPAVPPPAGTLPQYWRFGILATDPTTGSAALLPILLRVGTGGTNG